MDTSILFGKFESIIPLSDALKERITSYLVEETLKRKSILLKEGQTCNRIFFIYKGFARAYHYDDGKEFTTWFMGERDIIVSVHSFYKQAPSFEQIEMLEDSLVQSISYESLQTLYRDFPEFNIIGRILTEYYYLLSEERAISLRTLSAKERYFKLLKDVPDISQRASLGQIASYLGISQETVSRIRANNH